MAKPVSSSDDAHPMLAPRLSRSDQQLIERQTVLPEVTEMIELERDAEAYRLTVLGWAGWRVRAALGYSTVTEVGDALERYRRDSLLPEDHRRMVMVGQLDEAIARTMGVLGHTHFKVHKGTLIMVPSDPCDPASVKDTDTYVPLIDDGPTLDAAKTLAVLLDRKARLLGLDAPERHEHTIIPLPGVAQNWVAQKRAQAIEGTTNG